VVERADWRRRGWVIVRVSCDYPRYRRILSRPESLDQLVAGPPAGQFWSAPADL